MRSQPDRMPGRSCNICHKWRFGAIFLAPVVALLLLLGIVLSAEELRPGAVERIVSKRVAHLISRHHYNRRPLDDEVSKKLFKGYFERLDHGRSFFLASDIEEFRPRYELILDDMLLRDGNVDFGFEVYTRFLQRVRERVEFVRARLQEPFDFTLEEELLLDRSNEPWYETREELDELWRQRIKNNLIVYRMMYDKDLSAAYDEPPDSEIEELNEELKERNTLEADAFTKKLEDRMRAELLQQLGKERDTVRENKAAEEHDAVPKALEEEALEHERIPADLLAHLESLPSPKTPEERVLLFYERYLHQLEENGPMDVLEIFLSALTRIYDPHSAYMAPDTEEDFDISMKLSLQGIGAILTTEDALVKVAGILPGGPADQDGRLKEGDRIVAVAQEGEERVDVIDMPLRRVVRMIRGPEGTRVILTVLEAGKALGSVPTRIDIVRGEIKLTEQEARCEQHSVQLFPAAEDGQEVETLERQLRLAVIELPSFYTDFKAKRDGVDDYKSSTRDVEELIRTAMKDGIDGLVLDLRGNGGGSLDEAIRLAGLFLPGGPVVQVRQSDGKVEKRYDPDEEVVYGGPLVVLVDRQSASASEIVAAALQDHYRAVILGEESTHGKGTVQTVYHMDGNLRRSKAFKDVKAGSLKFTMAKFYRVTGGSTQVKGVTPNIFFPSYTDHMELGEAHLPRVLPWDEIEPLMPVGEVDVRRFLATLSERSELRLTRDEQYQEHLRDIDRFGERKKRKFVTLNYEDRVKLQEEEKAWSEKLRQATKRRRSRTSRISDDELDERGTDFIIDEGLNVLTDLVLLQSGSELHPATSMPSITKLEPASIPVSESARAAQ